MLVCSVLGVKKELGAGHGQHLYLPPAAVKVLNVQSIWSLECEVQGARCKVRGARCGGAGSRFEVRGPKRGIMRDSFRRGKGWSTTDKVHVRLGSEVGAQKKRVQEKAEADYCKLCKRLYCSLQNQCPVFMRARFFSYPGPVRSSLPYQPNS